eukprot:CAMPEP_0197459574 /NCGR_PEP_ID=MMETSP1175-20131217/51760_1 /TAXON_ID=1003142 /ORGANISM="Triceratium dubium, Strain CCMP147" /LENGTH=595 /DNA_ID=CAMNT_0042994489 /DNA_START=141 /DNA_END=1928 /DNA_ORIENTATION=+
MTLFPPAIASSFWLTTFLSTGVFVALTAVFYHIFAGRMAEVLSKLKVSVPCGNEGGTKDIRLGRNIRKLIPATGGNVWWQLFYRSASDLSGGSESSGDRVLRRRLTSIGRFSLRTQTERNPSIISFFLAFSNQRGRDGMNMKELEWVWRKRVMDRHERFRSRICEEDDRFFEVCDKPPFDLYAKDVAHPKEHRVELNDRIEHLLTSHLNVRKRLWEAKLSTGPLGSSGAISTSQIESRNLKDKCDTETVALFRIHHALADGVSMSVALGDATDEAEELNHRIMSEIEKRKLSTNLTLVQKIKMALFMFLFYILGGVKALALQGWRCLVAFSPFDIVMAQSNILAGRRSTTWKILSSTNNIKEVAKSISKSATLNDVSVAIVTGAIRRQLVEHQKAQKLSSESKKVDPIVIPSRVNVTIPVHLNGGVLLPGESLGNKIGAFVASVPLTEKEETADHCKASNRFKGVSKALKEGKSTPAYLIAWTMAKFTSDYAPEWFAKWAMRNGNAKSVCVISNVKGFPFKVHWVGRRLEYLCAFLPLPPGIPIGVVVSSYDGEIGFTVDADKRAVPDADRFGEWMIDEFKRLEQEARVSPDTDG